MKRVKGSNEAATLLKAGPIDIVGHGEPRLATGYSPLELERAGLTVARARDLGLPIDEVRTTGIGANVLQLRRQFGR